MFAQAKPGRTMRFEPTDKIKRFFPEGTVVMYTCSSLKALVMHLPWVPKVFFSRFWPDAWCRPQADRSSTDGTSPK